MKVNNNDVRLEANKKVSTKRVIAKNANGLSLQDDGGNYIKINDGGIVDISKTSCCLVYLGSDQSIPTAVRTIIEFDTEVFDYQDEYNTSTHRFTASSHGYYAVTAQGEVGTLGDGDHFIVALYKNGSIFTDCRNAPGGSTGPRMSASKIIEMNKNDYIEFKIYHSFGSALNAIAGQANNSISIHKLG